MDPQPSGAEGVGEPRSVGIPALPATPGTAPASDVPCARNLTRGTVIAVRLEIAESFAGRFMGLMGRATLARGAGLWLRPGSSIHMLFMRFPIDAVFLAKPGRDGGRRVVAVHPSLRPWLGVVWWARGADGCLELAAGAAAASGTTAGDVIVLEGVDASRG